MASIQHVNENVSSINHMNKKGQNNWPKMREF